MAFDASRLSHQPRTALSIGDATHRFFVSAISSLLISFPVFAQQPDATEKIDIRGIAPGMTKSELLKQGCIADKPLEIVWWCKRGDANLLAKVGDGGRVYYVEHVFDFLRSPQELLGSIAEQYKVSPGSHPLPPWGELVWKFSSGVSMKIWRMGGTSYKLSIYNYAIETEKRDADRARLKQQPPPRF